MRNLGFRLAASRALCLTTSIAIAACGDRDASRVIAPPPTRDVDVESDGPGTQSNLWTWFPALPTARVGHAAINLNSCLWSIGGGDGWYVATSTQVDTYCPGSSSSWSPGPALPEARTHFGGVGVIGKKVYAAGGIDSAGMARNTLYIYAAATGWRLSGDSMPAALACGDASVIDGKLYVYGLTPLPPPDSNGGACETPMLMVYDPAKAVPPRWTILPTPPRFRCDATIESVATMLYVVGGDPSCGGEAIGMSEMEAFNTATSQWLPPNQWLPGVPDNRQGVTSTMLSNRIYAFGGYNGDLSFDPTHEVNVFDPTTNTWDEIRPLQSGHYYAAAVVSGTKLVVIDGFVEALNVTGCDVHEPDGTVAKSNPWHMINNVDFTQIVGAAMTQARLCAANDLDYFVLEPWAGSGYQTHVSLELTAPPGQDYQLELFDVTGKTRYARSTQTGSSPDSISFGHATKRPPYVLRVKSQNGTFDAKHPYQLVVIP